MKLDMDHLRRFEVVELVEPKCIAVGLRCADDGWTSSLTNSMRLDTLIGAAVEHLQADHVTRNHHWLLRPMPGMPRKQHRQCTNCQLWETAQTRNTACTAPHDDPPA